MFPEALAQADDLDKYFAEKGRPVGPLHGLPTSVKDNFNIVGKDSTLGFVSWCNKPQTSESVLISQLRSLGAVVYVKTNVPTAMLRPETINHVFGR